MPEVSTEDDPDKVASIAVLGGGSAGYLCALAIKKHLPDMQLTVVRSTAMGVIGVGEGTIWSVVNYLHNFLGIDPQRFHQACQPSIKLGIRYVWGPRPFFNYTFAPQLTALTRGLDLPKGYFCDQHFDYADLAAALMCRDRVCLKTPRGEPQMPASYAYHLENQLFVAFLEEIATEWGIDKIDDVVVDVQKGSNGVESLTLQSGRSVNADFFVDCSGFRAELIEKALGEPFVSFNDALFCDSAIFGGWERTREDAYHPYTTAETMRAGWSWQIEHDHLVNRGYVFSSSFISDDEADAEFRSRNPRVEASKVIRFTPGRRRNAWVKNVLALGNAAGFVEPLEATAIGMICDASLNFVRALTSSGGRNAAVLRDTYNRSHSENWDLIRDFLAVHYRFNTRLQTPFWTACVHDTPLGGAEKYVDLYREVGPDFSLVKNDLKRDFFDAEGYLAMLVGQAVPYRRKVSLSPRQKHTWKLYLDGLRDSTLNAMDMTEFTRFMRGTAVNHSAARPTHRFDINAQDAGELRWH